MGLDTHFWKYCEDDKWKFVTDLCIDKHEKIVKKYRLPTKLDKILCIENKWAYFGKVRAYKKKRGVVRSPTFFPLSYKTTYFIFD